ncbi:MAG TPA: hypothetical protein VE619_04660 [Nitrososphaeraceae archaeon]|nr:hypothetical protein [Nitrososphaeraceae archaeon]
MLKDFSMRTLISRDKAGNNNNNSNNRFVNRNKNRKIAISEKCAVGGNCGASHDA